MSQNVCAFVGRLTDRPAEGGNGNTNTRLANFTVAVQRNFKNRDGDYDADFVKCTVFGNGADYLLKYGDKADTVSVSGELRQNRWTDQQGNKHSYLYIHVNNISIVAHPQKSQVSRRHYESQQQPQQPQYEQQTVNTGNGGWSGTSAGQKREQVNEQNDQPVEINDDALPFQTKPEPPQSEQPVTNSDDLPF